MKSMDTMPKAVFISHGGGPLPLLGDPGHEEMVVALKALAEAIPRPKAIVVVSAHWEEALPTITAAAKPPLIYDYSGFPPESYEIEYPCEGSPELANTLWGLLEEQGIPARLDDTRGLDHGVFVPLKLMYPEADIPCVQLSLVDTLEPRQHIDMGQALHDLHKQGVLLIGSGFSFHNLRAFFSAPTPQSRELNLAFEDWLNDTCANPEYSAAQRRELLSHWDAAPGARYCHPREEHLIPLHVCYGAALAPCRQRITATILDKASAFYIW